ncbi:hypothetical protein E4U22_003786 [Claviceps purpurea]|nr:hypothetical protein E4U28_005013 [Claviceps purpurea]KAG6320074.1 hypothetical protein E4U22_003786 [Claviceps purpurea]
MALSRVDGQDNLYVGGIWALRRSDILAQKHITHVLSVVGFSPDSLKNFKDEPWSMYGKQFRHELIDLDDVDEANLLVELPSAVRFIHQGLQVSSTSPSTGDNVDAAASDTSNGSTTSQDKAAGGVFVHCAAGKSRSVSVIIAYLLWRYPRRFDPDLVPASAAAYGNPGGESSSRAVLAASANSDADTPMDQRRSRKQTAQGAVEAALALVRQTRPMAEPNDGFMEQLALWWEMGCPADIDSDNDNSNSLEKHPLYQRWVYKREVEEHIAVGQAPSRLRFEDEDPSAVAVRRAEASHRNDSDADTAEITLRCKKCRRTLATAPFINQHVASTSSKSLAPGQPCPHYFVEPLSWMRGELEKGLVNGRLSCPNERCGAAVGRYDWKGIRCACGGWVTPGLSLQRARVDEEVRRKPGMSGSGPGCETGAGTGSGTRAGAGMGAGEAAKYGIRMPPGSGAGRL